MCTSPPGSRRPAGSTRYHPGRGPASRAAASPLAAGPWRTEANRGSQPADGRQPGLRRRGTEPRIDHELIRRDAGHGPAIAERGDELVPADPAWAPVARLAVAEAHQVVAAAGAQHRSETGDVLRALRVVEHVEQPAVGDGVEGQAERPEVQRISDLE